VAIISGSYAPGIFGHCATKTETSSPMQARILSKQLYGCRSNAIKQSFRRSRQATWSVSVCRVGSTSFNRSTLNRCQSAERSTIQSGLQTASAGTFDGFCVRDTHCRIDGLTSVGIGSSSVGPVVDADSDIAGPVFEFSRPQAQQQQPRRLFSHALGPARPIAHQLAFLYI